MVLQVVIQSLDLNPSSLTQLKMYRHQSVERVLYQIHLREFDWNLGWSLFCKSIILNIWRSITFLNLHLLASLPTAKMLYVKNGTYRTWEKLIVIGLFKGKENRSMVSNQMHFTRVWFAVFTQDLFLVNVLKYLLNVDI